MVVLVVAAERYHGTQTQAVGKQHLGGSVYPHLVFGNNSRLRVTDNSNDTMQMTVINALIEDGSFVNGQAHWRS